jgi:flavin-binding protein dodecin
MAIAKVIEITSESTKDYDDAVRSGIEEAARTVDNIQSAWVKDHEVRVRDDRPQSHRVSLKVTFLVENGSRA